MILDNPAQKEDVIPVTELSIPTNLTPYDTGARLQPQPWSLETKLARENMTSPTARAFEDDRYGRVDFDNDESATIVTSYVERLSDGRHALHLEPHIDPDQLLVAVHTPAGILVIESSPKTSV